MKGVLKEMPRIRDADDDPVFVDETAKLLLSVNSNERLEELLAELPARGFIDLEKDGSHSEVLLELAATFGSSAAIVASRGATVGQSAHLISIVTVNALLGYLTYHMEHVPESHLTAMETFGSALKTLVLRTIALIHETERKHANEH